MEKISLRGYIHEIEVMIEDGRLDEAIAHCQHILEDYPIHIETYRLLGKAFLEARRYVDAADIFQQILLAVPDDFISQVGMSIIRDSENKLDDAILHMERAYQVQPSNSAIQGELRRLYGRRDGVEPATVRLSREALANMYAQGELYSQAISELHSVLAEDPSRLDLQVILLRATYRSGQKDEAVKMAASLLEKFPNCLDALLIIDEVHPVNTDVENLQAYRQRLSQLDPYLTFRQNSVISSDQVPDSAVELERLDYKPELSAGSSHSGWDSSLGIQLESENRVEPAPGGGLPGVINGKPADTNLDHPETKTSVTLEAEADLPPAWMRSAGPSEPAGEGKAGQDVPENGLPDRPISRIEIPEWLMSEELEEAIPETNTAPERSLDYPLEAVAGFPDWLMPMDPSEKAEPQKTESIDNKGSLPDNGEDLLQPAAPVDISDESYVNQVKFDETESDDIPDWLKVITPITIEREVMIEHEPVESQAESADTVPEFLRLVSMAEAGADVSEEDALDAVNEQPPEEGRGSGDGSSGDEGQPAVREGGSTGFPAWITGLEERGVEAEVMSVTGDQPAGAADLGEEQGSQAGQLSGKGDQPEVERVSSEEKGEAAPEENVDLADTQPVIRVEDGSVAVPSKSVEMGDDGLDKVLAELPGEERPTVPEQELPNWIKGFESHFKRVEIPDAEDELPEWLRNSTVNNGDVPDFLKTVALAEAAAERIEEDAQEMPSSVVAEDAEGGPKVDEEVMITEDTDETNGTALVSAGEPVLSREVFPEWMREIGAGEVGGGPSEAEMAVETDISEDSFEYPEAGGSVPEQAVAEQKIQGVPAAEFPDFAGPAVLEKMQPQGSESVEVFEASGHMGELQGNEEGGGVSAEGIGGDEAQPAVPEDGSAGFPSWMTGLEEQGGEASEIPEDKMNREPPGLLSLEPVGGLDAEAMPVTGDQPADAADLGEEQGSQAGQPAGIVDHPALEPVSGEEDSLAWLERVSGDHEEMSEATEVSTEEKVEGTLEENADLADTQPVIRMEEGSVSVPPTSEGMVEEGLGKVLAELPGEERPAVLEQELPGWLKGLESPSMPDETQGSGNDLPEWQHPPIEEPEDTSELDMPGWMDENIPVSGQAVPTLPGEWITSEVNPEADLGPIPIPEFIPVDGNLPVEGDVPELPALTEPSPENLSVSEPDSVGKIASDVLSVSQPEPSGQAESVIEALPVSEREITTSLEEDYIALPESNPESMTEPELIGAPSPSIESQPVYEHEQEAKPETVTETQPESEPEQASALEFVAEIPPILGNESSTAPESVVEVLPESEPEPATAPEFVAEILPVSESESGNADELDYEPHPVSEPERAAAPDLVAEIPSVSEPEPISMPEIVAVTPPDIESRPTSSPEPEIANRQAAVSEEVSVSDLVPADASGPVIESLLFSKPEPVRALEQVIDAQPVSGPELVASPGPVPVSESDQTFVPHPVTEEPISESGQAAAPEPTTEYRLASEPEIKSASEPDFEALPASEPVLIAESTPSLDQNYVAPLMTEEVSFNVDVPGQDKDAELLNVAQTALAQNSLDESMKQYTKLIKKGHLLEKVIQDLREAIYHFPADMNIWQTLGDAYMRANRIQDALDAYGKAEELLR